MIKHPYFDLFMIALSTLTVFSIFFLLGRWANYGELPPKAVQGPYTYNDGGYPLISSPIDKPSVIIYDPVKKRDAP